MYCPYCREVLKDTDRFCTRCGQKLPVLPQNPVSERPAPQWDAHAVPAPPASPAVLVASLVGALLCLIALAAVALAPLVSVRPLEDASGLLLSAAAQLNGPLAVAASPYLGEGVLGALSAVGLVSSYADATGGVGVAVGLGCVLGIALVCAVLLVAGVVACALRCRPTGALVIGCAGVALLCLAACVAVLVCDAVWVPQLRNAVGAMYGGAGPRVSAPAHVMWPAPWLWAAAAAAVAGWCAALGARRRWRAEHPRLH